MLANPGLSFNEIYTTFYRKSFLYVKSYVQDDMAAEDIVSDTLIKLWEQMKQKHIDPVDAYLFTMLKNQSLDYLKHQVVKRESHDSMEKALMRELEIRTSSLQSSDPDEIFSNEIQQIFTAALQSLPEKTREIFLMSRFGNKSYKEIAALYQISVKGVDYHIDKTLKELRTALKDYLPLIGFFSFLNV